MTGEHSFKNKGALHLIDDGQRINDTEISNVFYARSYVVRGHGTAVVCAVGHRTQFGMVVDLTDDHVLRDEDTPFKDKLM